MNLSKTVFAVAVAAVLAMAASAQAVTIVTSNSTFGAFDASSGNRTLGVAGGPFNSITDVNIEISFAKCDDPAITSPGPCVGTGLSFNNEIVFRLTSPSGTTVNLVNAGTYSGQTPGASVIVLFDEDSGTPVGGPSLLNGTFNPVGNLDAFVGENPLGNWTLFIQDTTFDDPLSFFSATLTIQTPEPVSVALLGLGLLGLGFSRRLGKK